MADTDLHEGDNFYRVKSVYEDGSFTWSPVRKIEFLPASAFEVFPNPTAGAVSLYLKQFQGKTCDLVIHNSWGIEIYREHFAELKDNILNLDFRERNWQSGLYMVSIIRKGKAFSRKLLVIKND